MIKYILLTILLTIVSITVSAHPSQPKHKHYVQDQEFLNRGDSDKKKPVKKRKKKYVKKVIKPKPELPLYKYPQFKEYLASRTDKIQIIINVGSQQLVVIDNYEVVLNMRIIVGKKGWRTPVRQTQIEYIIANPYWNVPASIAIDETIPKIKRNVEKYQRLGFRVLVDNETYNAEYVNFFAPSEMKIRQLPGTWNTLGRIKYKLKNMNGVFMHDTSVRSRFNKSNRFLSHGCIRLQKPLQLLKAISNIEYIESKEEKWYKLKNPIKVNMVNWKKIKIKE